MAKNKKVFQGEFYTPESLSKKSNELMCDTFGDDWRLRYIVWDCASGHGALTKDSEYENLYQSTLEQSNIDDMILEKINPEGTKFKFDFLNDNLEGE